MKRATVGVAVMMTLAAGALSVRTEPEPARVALRCQPGARECARPGASRTPLEEHHPCGWVETCSLPCGREGGTCCHAEWDCPPPEANAPRC